jgi:hypothetical protein
MMKNKKNLLSIDSINQVESSSDVDENIFFHINAKWGESN